MSRYRRTSGDGKYLAFFGYDRPLNYIFLDIEKNSGPKQEDEFVYTCLDEPDVFKRTSLHDYDNILKEYQFDISSSDYDMIDKEFKEK